MVGERLTASESPRAVDSPGGEGELGAAGADNLFAVVQAGEPRKLSVAAAAVLLFAPGTDSEEEEWGEDARGEELSAHPFTSLRSWSAKKNANASGAGDTGIFKLYLADAAGSTVEFTTTLEKAREIQVSGTEWHRLPTATQTGTRR